MENVPSSISIPWRDAGGFGPGLQFTAEGHTRNPGEEDQRAHFRAVGPGYFATLGIPIVAGRDFNESDRRVESMS